QPSPSSAAGSISAKTSPSSAKISRSASIPKRSPNGQRRPINSPTRGCVGSLYCLPSQQLQQLSSGQSSERRPRSSPSLSLKPSSQHLSINAPPPSFTQPITRWKISSFSLHFWRAWSENSSPPLACRLSKLNLPPTI